jgi:serine/threonine-protein kinase
LLSNRSSFRRFEREAQASARLNHRNIVTVYDYGVAKPEGAFLCMELINGQTWRTELRHLGAFPAQLAADWLDQLLEGVAAAHEQGVIHRDLKPENVLISPEPGTSGVIKVLDFGLAKLRLLNFSDPDSLTLAGTVIGTLGYMSPEQFTAGEVDERSDIFSLGVMTVEALTGRRPFEGQSAGEVLKSLLQKSVQFNGESRDTKDLNRVLRLSLAKDAKSRYRFVRDMRAELIPALRNCRSEFALRLGQNEQARTISLGG